ncbi:MAG: SOS response-associated peptidase, partial [Pseudomonadota bacterium]
MCGRYTLSSRPEALQLLFELEALPPLAPRYNIAPTQAVPVVRQHGAGREMTLMRWGLIPSWAKDPGIGARLINARAEGAADKPAFRAAFRRRRCLIPADGFYEWRNQNGRKQPFYFRREDGTPFAFAGLWEHWHGP